MTNRTASPIASLWTDLERVEPRYERARAVEDRIMARHGAGSDNPILNRAIALTDRIGGRLGATVSAMVSIRATTPGDLAIKAAVALRRHDDLPALQAVASDALAMVASGCTPRQRTSALLSADQLRGAVIR